MSDWFFIQQLSAKRWSYVGKEMNIEDAVRLFNTLNSSFSESTCAPLAVVSKKDQPEIAKVIQNKEELTTDWEQVVINARFISGDKPLLVKRVET